MAILIFYGNINTDNIQLKKSLGMKISKSCSLKKVAELMTGQSKEHIEKELGDLLKFFHENGDIRDKSSGYLKTNNGKKILILVEKLDLTWPKTVKILKRSQGVIEHARSYHSLQKDLKKHIIHSPERIDLLKEYHARSKSVRTRKESSALSKEMLGAFNALPGRQMSKNGMWIVARSEELEWGYSGKKTENWNQDKKVLFTILYDRGDTPKAIAKHPKFKKDFDGISSLSMLVNRCAEQLGCNHKKRKVTINQRKAEEKLSSQKDAPPKKEIPKEQILENLPLEIRKWDDPKVFEISPDVWSQPTIRVGSVSGIAYLNTGFRAGAVDLAFEKLRDEGPRFVEFAGLLIDKHGFAKKLRKRLNEAKEHLKEQKEQASRHEQKISTISASELKEQVVDNLIEETAKALSALIPRLKKPSRIGKVEYVRLYIQISPTYDGPYGERIARALQALRPDDIRVDRPGSDRHFVKDVEKYIGVLTPRRNRMPSQYYSNAPEKEIRDEVGRTSRIPGLWIVAPFASNVYTPDGGLHETAYITLPGLRNLEEVYTAENQIGVTILEYESPDALPLKRSWSFRDCIENERSFINPPRGATDLQKKIIGLIQKRGAQHIGEIADRFTEHSRDDIEREINELVEKEMRTLKTWPGLSYDEGAQRYDFRLDWVQERLRYRLPEKFEEDRMLFFGCPHFGYTTTDYQHIIKEYPRIILEKNIKYLFGLGDFIAGMAHNLPHSGEIFAGTNYSDHEKLAAEGIATIIYNVFIERLRRALKARSSRKKITVVELSQLIHDSLIYFINISGNHDEWVTRDGHTALEIFRSKLPELLTHHIGKKLIGQNLPSIDIRSIVEDHIVSYQDVEAVHTLPSKLKVGMLHPHEGGAKTTTLKLQEMLGVDGCQIWAIANYHRATFVREWRMGLGERIGIMAGAAGPIYTFFERRKRKRNNDFGPIYVRVLSHEQRIIMDEVGYYNKPILKGRMDKNTDLNVLKKDLGLLTI